MAAVSPVDIDPLVTVVGVIGQRLGVKHEQSTRSPAVVGDGGSLHSELVRCAGLALADALDLRLRPLMAA